MDKILQTKSKIQFVDGSVTFTILATRCNFSFNMLKAGEVVKTIYVSPARLVHTRNISISTDRGTLYCIGEYTWAIKDGAGLVFLALNQHEQNCLVRWLNEI